MKSLARKYSVILLIIHFSISTANNVAFSNVMNQALKKYGIGSQQIAIYSLVSLPFAICTIIAAA